MTGEACPINMKHSVAFNRYISHVFIDSNRVLKCVAAEVAERGSSQPKDKGQMVQNVRSKVNISVALNNY